jgi:two-component system chemotaxis family response regulator WspR
VRTRAPLAVIMIDIDEFKPFNDTFGHQKGDERLRQVAAALADCLPRSGDILARYGGEEFAGILPSTDAAGAMVVAEQLRRSVAARQLPHGAPGAGPTITVSCGVAVVVPDLALSPQALVVAADLALYDAKRAGRNRVARRDVDGAVVA